MVNRPLFCYIWVMEYIKNSIDVVYVRFDKNLDYKMVVNSFPIKKFLESAFGDFPHMVTPTKFEFDRDKLGEFIQDEYDMSKQYVIDSKKVPTQISEEYTTHNGGDDLTLMEFETELLLDDHIVTVNQGDRVLGVFATEDDFEHIIDEYE